MENMTLEDIKMEKAMTRLLAFKGGDPLKVNYYSGSGVELNRWELRVHLQQFGVIKKLYLSPDGKEGSVVYAEGANLDAVTGTIVDVAGDKEVFFVHGALPRVFLGGLPSHATNDIIKEAVKPYGKLAKIERPQKNGRPAPFCFLIFCKRQHLIRILQETRITVIQTKVTVRMEGEEAQPDLIYKGDSKSWKPGRTLMLYGFRDPEEVTEEDVRESLQAYGKTTAANFVHRKGRRHPLCFVDFEEDKSVVAAMKAPGGCVKGQIVGFMEVTREYLASITGRGNQRIKEDEYDNDQGFEFMTEPTDEEKEQAILSAIRLTDGLGRKFLPDVGPRLSIALEKRAIETVTTEGQKRKSSDDFIEPLKKRVRVDKYEEVKEVVEEFAGTCLEGRDTQKLYPVLDELTDVVDSLQKALAVDVDKKRAEERAEAEANRYEPPKYDKYEIDESLRVFIQNLPEDATVKTTRDYFSQFGEVERVYINKHYQGFVLFDLRQTVKEVLSKKHVISGREIRVLKTLPEPRKQWPQVYVGGIPPEAGKDDVAWALSVFGNVEDVVLPQGKNFGFVSFRDEAAVSRALAHGHAYLGRYHRLTVRPASRSGSNPGQTQARSR